MSFIPLMRVALTANDLKAVEDVLRSGMLVQGEHVAALEGNIAAATGVAAAIAVASGTASLHLALVSSGICDRDEVIVPAFSYVATANVVELTGATPVFVDIDTDSCNIDTTKIEERITAKTKAIIPVHEFGLPCDITEIMKIATKHSLYVIEDGACALAAEENKQPVGSFGDLGAFSFHPRKAITSGEGGIITTNDPEHGRRLRALRNHGIAAHDGQEQFMHAGYNYRMTDFQAALLNSQLERLDKQLAKKNEIAQYYRDTIRNPRVTVPACPPNKKHTWQTFHVLLDKTINRDETIARLKTENIGTNYGAQCIPFLAYYQEKYGLDCPRLFPNALNAYQQGLAIPLYDGLTGEEMAHVAAVINKI